MAKKKAAVAEAPAEAAVPEPVQPTESTPAETAPAGPAPAEQRTKEPASASAGEERPSTYFRKLLKKNPKLLKDRDNDAIYQMWLTDHPGHASVPKNVKQLLSNIKSTMRKAREERKASQETTTPKAPPSNGIPAPAKPARSPAKSLEQLEAKLDDCLYFALEQGTEELEAVIQLLRKARRHVILLGL